MKIIISHEGVKRELQTPFRLCMAMDDLDALVESLKRARRMMGDCTFGWMRIDPEGETEDSSPANTPPLPWK